MAAGSTLSIAGPGCADVFQTGVTPADRRHHQHHHRQQHSQTSFHTRLSAARCIQHTSSLRLPLTEDQWP